MKTEARLLYPQVRDTNPEDGYYVWVDPDEESVLRIQQLMRGCPFKTPNTTEYHATVIHHGGKCPIGDGSLPGDQEMEAHMKALVPWTDHKGETIVVGLLDTPDLETIHRQLRAFGLRHGFPDYTPHITLGKRVQMTMESRLWLHMANKRLQQSPLYVRFEPKLKGSSAA